MRARNHTSMEVYAGWEIAYYRTPVKDRIGGERAWEAYLVEEDASFAGDSRSEARAAVIAFINTVLGQHPYANVQVIAVEGE